MWIFLFGSIGAAIAFALQTEEENRKANDNYQDLVERNKNFARWNHYLREENELLKKEKREGKFGNLKDELSNVQKTIKDLKAKG